MKIIGVNKWSNKTIEEKLSSLSVDYTRRDIGQGLTSECYALEYNGRVAYVLVSDAIPDDPIQASVVCDGHLDNEDKLSVARFVEKCIEEA